jgi:hypothetical protein
MARKGKKQVFYLDHMDKIIHISVKDGMTTVDKCPKGCVILIKDYNTQDTNSTVHKKYKDENGQTYTLEVYDHVNFKIKNNDKVS